VSLIGLLLVGGHQSITAQSTLTGRLSFAWSDPVEGDESPTLLLYLISDSGTATLLDFSNSAVPQYQDIIRMSGERVTARGAFAAAAGTASQAPFIVQDLDWIRPADMTVGPITGPQPWVTLRCRFGDSPGVDRAIDTNLLTGTTYPSLDEYWRETSLNNINLSGSMVNDWVTLPQPRSYYIYDTNGDGFDDTDLARLATDCTAASDATVNFTNFVGINLLFNQNFSCCFWGGGWLLNLDGQTKVWRTTWIGLPWDDYEVLFQGLAHEAGHGFGLPHSSGPYGFVYDSAWDVMSQLGVNWDSDIRQYNPQGTISYHKDIGGWIPSNRRFVPTQGTTTTITIERLAVPISSATYLMAQIPIAGSSTHFYTVEMRQLVGHDAGVPGNAVVIHNVDTTRRDSWARVVDPDNNGNPNDAGAMWMPGETFADIARGIFVTVNSLNATSATVTITVPGPVSKVRELILDFGAAGGLWSYRWGAAWTQIHPTSPESIAVGDLDGNGRDDLIIDFGSAGIWILLNNTSWRQLHPSSPNHIATGDLDNNGLDDIILDFPGAGIWIYHNNTTWSQLHGLNSVRVVVGNIDGSAGDDLVIEFAGSGIWSYRNSSTWGQIHPTNAQAIGVGDIDGTGRDDVIIAFQGGGGTWSYLNNTSWSFLHSATVTLIAAGDMDGNAQDELAVSIPGQGIWMLVNGPVGSVGSTWWQPHPQNPDEILLVDVDGNGGAEVVVDFGVGYGIWTFNGTAWVQVHPTSPEITTSGDIVQ
jgi:M6 family metalloprotease-like protein